MKAPQDCTGVNVKLEAKKSKKKKKGGEQDENETVNGNGSLKRASTGSSAAQSVNTSLSPGLITPTSPTSLRSGTRISTKSVTESPPSPSTNGSNVIGKVLYPYDAASSQELTVKPG